MVFCSSDGEFPCLLIVYKLLNSMQLCCSVCSYVFVLWFSSWISFEWLVIGFDSLSVRSFSVRSFSVRFSRETVIVSLYFPDGC